jgi:tetratricopeptide (TPR) repeat protein
MGRFDEWYRLTSEEIKHHPGNIMLRFALVEGLLHSGRLDEAETAIAEAASLASNHDFLPVMRADLAILREDYKAACVELRKTIGGKQEEEIAGLYYRLGKLYALRGDRKEALRHLDIARHLAPEFNYKTTDELKALVEGHLEYRPAYPDLPEPCLQFNHERGRQAALAGVLSCRHGLDIASSTVYIFPPKAEPSAVRAWLPFNENRLAAPSTARIFLPALPLSSFLDERGNPLRADFSRVQSEYGRYCATVAYPAPLRLLTLAHLETRLNLEGLWARRQGGVIDLRLDETCQRPGWRTHILALPQDTEVQELSARADEELKRDGWRFLVFSRFFYDREHFRLKAKFRHKSD